MNHVEHAAVVRLVRGGCSDEEVASIRRHLEGCADCAARVRRYEEEEGRTKQAKVGPPGSDAPTLPAALPDGPMSPLPRRTLVGRYVILHLVGEGGMGVVYAAFDPDLERQVALKLLHPAGKGRNGHGEAQARLLREAQAMARVSHPNVTAVHDVGTHGDQVFVAMELVDGTNLRQWLLQEPRSWRQVLQVLLEAGRGLAAAHRAGLVHRDFKPENVLVGKDGRVRVTDFGLAKLAGADERTDEWTDERTDERPEARPEPSLAESGTRLLSPLTQRGVVVGTPSYMAPELHRGAAPDARSDQFSFCATLYFALYGTRPFDPRRLAAAAREQTQEDSSHATSFLPRSGVAAPPDLIHPPPRAPRVPSRVRRALLRGLSLAPEARFPSIDVALEHLARPPATARYARAALMLALLAGAAGLAYRQALQHESALCSGAEARLAGIWDSDVARQVEAAFRVTGKPYARDSFAAVKSALDRYTARWVALHTDTCRATRVRGEQTEQVLSLRMACLDRRLGQVGALTALLGQADGATVDKAVDAVGALPGLARCSNVAALSAPDGLPDSQEARRQIQRLSSQLAEARALEDAGRYKPGLERARAVVAESEKLAYRPLRAEALLAQGSLQHRLGDFKGARQSLTDAVWIAEAGRHDEVSVLAASKLMLIAVNFSEGRFDEAELWSRLAGAALERMGGSEELEMNLLASRVNLICRRSTCADAKDLMERTVALADRVLGPDHVRRSLYLSILAAVYQDRGELPKARKLMEESLALAERLRGKQHPANGYPYVILADLLLEQGERSEALARAARGRELLETSLGPTNPMVAGAYDVEARVLLELGQPAEALAKYRHALETKEKALGPQAPNLAVSLDGMAETYLALKQPAEALAVAERALALHNPEKLRDADVRLVLARALAASGRDRPRARALATEARATYESLGKQASVAKADALLGWLPR